LFFGWEKRFTHRCRVFFRTVYNICLREAVYIYENTADAQDALSAKDQGREGVYVGLSLALWSTFEGSLSMNQDNTATGSRADHKLSRQHPSLSGFQYQNGYRLSATDLGKQGVKIELLHRDDAEAAIILPPKEVGKYGKWLLQTLGQDRYGLPKELPDILKRLSKQKGAETVLQRGDKKRIGDALKTLQSTT
jgi:hypothetical protein